MTGGKGQPVDAGIEEQIQCVDDQPENPFAALIPDQNFAVVPSFVLESGVNLKNVPIAYSTQGTLNEKGDNVIVICHAVSGSADVKDWWGPLVGGPGKAFDTSRFFVICLNSLGSPYGSASPVTNIDGDAKLGRYGPDFPLTTVRDDVKVHKMILDNLGVRQIAAVVGGSMGGMLTLEYAYFGKDYVRTIVPIATSSRHSAWGISWGEQQRQSIYADPKYDDGYYPFEDPPLSGLGAARMSALLTYRSRNSFETRFGRNVPDPSRQQGINGTSRPATPHDDHWAVHNEGHKNARGSRPVSVHRLSPPKTPPSKDDTLGRPPDGVRDLDTQKALFTDPQFHGTTTFAVPTPPTPLTERKRATTYFSAQSYLRYQGEKFVKRFDSNCYIALTRKLDTHDVSRDRVPPEETDPVKVALSQIEQPALVLGIESDGLFTFAEQQEIAAGIPDARLKTIESPEGHDAFLLQFEQVNRYIVDFFNEVLPDVMQKPGIAAEDGGGVVKAVDGVGEIVKTSTFGEAEVGDFTAW